MATSIGFDIYAKDHGASTTFNKVGDAADYNGNRIGSTSGKFKTFAAAGITAMAGVAGAAGMVIASSSKLEQQYSKTMSLVGAATAASGKQMKDLDGLAMKMGEDTAFSANEAAGAMLELAKAGVKTSDIMGGGLKGTLLLATAGGTDLATASTIASNAMNTFALKGKDMGKIAAALAGGANASSASVESLGQALQQGGLSAKNAGLSLQETVGVLSMFDAAGLKGSDAGTSLKSMLNGLIPTTDKAKKAMEAANLDFVDAAGNFVNVGTMADQLKRGLGDLTQAQRMQALETIFGSDGMRAAMVLMKGGAQTVGEFTAAAHDQTAAQKMADAAMAGSSGAMEKLRGSVETLQLKVGKALAPTLTSLANWMSDKGIPAISATFSWLHEKLGPAFVKVGGWIRDELIPAISSLVSDWLVGARDAMSKLTTSVDGGQSTWDKFREVLSKVWAFTRDYFLPALGEFYKFYLPKIATAIGVVVDGISLWWGAMRNLWNAVLQPVLKLILTGFEGLLTAWEAIFSALSKVPGFGWAKGASEAMGRAAEKAGLIADNIKKIPSSKHVSVTVAYKYTGLRGPNGPGPTRGRDDDLDPGQEWSGETGKRPMSKARLEAQVDRIRDKLRGLRDDKRAIIESASGFTSSVFGFQAETEGRPQTAGAMINFQAGQAANAKALAANVSKLVGMGLSKSLIQQMMSQGESGMAQIAALAMGSKAEIDQLNALDKQTAESLHQAGLAAGGALFDDKIKDAETNLRHAQEELAAKVAEKVAEAVGSQSIEIHVDLNGKTIIRKVKKHNKDRGKPANYFDEE